MLAIGCDIGGTNSRSALIDVDTGNIIAKRHSPSPVGDYTVACAGIVADVRALQAEAGSPVTVGVAVAGHLDPSCRRVILAPNLKWKNAQLADDLERSLGVAVRLENDVRAAARGELAFGALKGAENGACVFWGSGIGGGIVMQGRVVVGGRALAGEVGHMTYVPGGLVCPCGKKGCFEAYIGGHALAGRMKKAKIPGANAKDLLRLAKTNTAARKLTQEVVLAGATLLANLTNALDPDKVVLGGGLGRALFVPAKAAMKPMLIEARRGNPLVRPALGDDAGLLGASTLAPTV